MPIDNKQYLVQNGVRFKQEANVMLSKERLREILEAAREPMWRHAIPRVRARLRLAITVLKQQDPEIFRQSPEVILNRLQKGKNHWIRKILTETENTVIAFAIRDACS